MIGDTGPAGFNIVSGNKLGIEVNGGSDRSTIAGNRIGTDYYGTTAAPNTNGVAIVADGLAEAPADVTVDAEHDRRLDQLRHVHHGRRPSGQR